MKRRLPINRLLISLVFLGLALVLGIGLTQSYAQATDPDSATTLVAIPPKMGDDTEILRIEPGEKIQVTTRVRNTSDKSLTVESFIKDFIVAEDGFTPVEVTDDVSNRWSLAKWMTIVPNAHKLGPGEIAQVNVLIEVPEDALPGGHYAMLLHTPSNNSSDSLGEEEANSASGINQRVGTLFYVIVEGPINEQAFVQNLIFKKFSEFGPVPYSYMVENQSDIHIKAKTRIDIYNLFGIKVGTIIPDPKNVFPMMSRSFEGQWDRKWGLGRYTAKLTMAYGMAGQVALASTNFWIVPIRLIIAILVGLIALSVIITMARKKKKTAQKAQEEHIQQLEKQVQILEDNKKSK